jgi:hypothetical protein
LPREVRRGGTPNRSTETLVLDGAEHTRQLRGNRPLRRNGAGDPSLWGALEGWKRADAEAKRARFDAMLAKASANLLGEERELMCPNAARHTQHEHALMEPDWASPLRNAQTHGVAPDARGNGRPHARKAVLTSPRQNRLERFRAGEGAWRAFAHTMDRIHGQTPAHYYQATAL